MSLTIDASNMLERRDLTVRDKGVRYRSGLFFGGKKFRYEEIAWVLLNRHDRLFFKARGEVYSIETEPRKTKHQKAIDALVKHLEGSDPRPTRTESSP